MTENIEANHIFDCNVVERNGKNYANVRGVRSKVKFGDYSLKFESDSAIPFAHGTINHILHANRRLILLENEPVLENVVSEIGHDIHKPIFSKIPMQDFFNGSYE